MELMESMELMKLMQKTIERVQLLLGETYFIRYNYNTNDECFIVRSLRRDCAIEVFMTFYKHDLDLEIHILSSFIAQHIISEFSDIIYKHEKGET